jgi:hypothetical protein
MVPVAGVDMWAVVQALAKAAADDGEQPAHARAFAAWIRHRGESLPSVLKALGDEAKAATGSPRSIDVAVLGFCVGEDSTYAAAFREAVSWLSQRQYFVSGRTPGFEVDGLALLGVAVGLRALDLVADEGSSRWLRDVLDRAIGLRQPADWNEALIAAAAETLGSQVSSERVTADLRVALQAKEVLVAGDDARVAAWPVISSLDGAADGMTRAAAQAAALSYLTLQSSTLRVGSNAVEDVAAVLRGSARSMRRWVWESAARTPRSAVTRWGVENEYHVQDFLWVILAPIFPDLDDEEWLKSLGQHHPRADLAIPSLKVIIEVKFARKSGKSFSDLIQEVAADASTYLQEGGGYERIIAFIWDDAARTEEHAELVQGLLRIRGVADAVVLSRPSKMDRSQPIAA